MRIAHIVSTFPPYKGGIGNACWRQVLELAKLGHEVTIFTPHYSTKAENAGQAPQSIEGKEGYTGLKIQCFNPWFKYGNAAFVPQIFHQLKDFDAVHLHYPFFGGAETVWLAKRFGRLKAPLVLQYHMDVVGTGLLKYFFSIYRRFFLLAILKAADKIIVSTLDYARNSDIKKYLQKEQQKFSEIPFGVTEDAFRPTEKETNLLKKYNLNKEDKVILFVGGLDRAHYFKGVDVLIKSFAIIHNSKFINQNLKLLIVGDGDMRLTYEKLVKDSELADCVIFASSVSNEDLPKYYNLADVFVLPSVDKSEAFGLVLLEAMACGVPVIASDLPGVRQVAKEGGLTFKVGDAGDLADKLKYLLENDGERKRLGEKGRKAAEAKYSWSRVAKELEGFILSCKVLKFKGLKEK